MVKFELPGGGRIGCVLLITIRGNKKGELTIEELEEIDEQVIEHSGIHRTGERINVESTRMEDSFRVQYEFEEKMSLKGLNNLKERLDVITSLDIVGININPRFTGS